MRVTLAVPYRIQMLALAPITLGVGTALLWLRSSRWPLNVDAGGVTLRNHQRVDWKSVHKIGVSRSLRDDRISQIRIHHEGGVTTIPANGLRDGDKVARVILRMFEQTKRETLVGVGRNREARAPSTAQSESGSKPGFEMKL